MPSTNYCPSCRNPLPAALLDREIAECPQCSFVLRSDDPRSSTDLGEVDLPALDPDLVKSAVGGGLKPPGPPPKVCFMVTDGQHPGRKHKIRSNSFFIGAGDADINLTDPMVPSKYARVTRRPEGFLVEVLVEGHQIVVNGTATSKHMLESGDELKIGDTSLIFVIRNPNVVDDSQESNSLSRFSP